MPTVIAFTAPSGTGKTTLLTALLPRLRRAGLRVGAVKHSHHRVEWDRPGKDSHRLREAGAEEVLLAAGGRWALFAEPPEPPPFADLLQRLDPSLDLVLVEGFGDEPLPRIRLYRRGVGPMPEWADPGLVAVASDVPLAAPVPRLDLNDPGAIARFILEYHRKESPP